MIQRESFWTGVSWTLGASVLVIGLYLLWRVLGAVGAMILPFVVGLVLALFLDPVADRLEARLPIHEPGKRRLTAVAIVFLGLLLVLAALLAFIVPNLVSQTSRLVAFFAPLSYQVEAARPGQRYRVLARDVNGSSYTIRQLRNDRCYVFRVIARDSDGQQYVLRPVRATPTRQGSGNAGWDIVAPISGVANVRPNPVETRRPPVTPSPEPSPSVGTGSEDGSDTFPVFPSETPTPAASPSSAPPLFTPILPEGTASPLPSPAPNTFLNGESQTTNDGLGEVLTDGNGAGDIAPEDAPTSEENAEIATGGTLNALPTGSLSPTPQPTDSVVPGRVNLQTEPVIPEATPSVAQRPTTRSEASPAPSQPANTTPSPLPSARATAPVVLPTATPSLASRVTPSPLVRERTRDTDATPVASPTPTSPTSVPRAEAGQNTPALSRASETRSRPVIVPRPGTVVALPGDQQVRLLWKAPDEAASGFDRLRAQADHWLTEHRSIGPVRLPPNLAAIQAQYSDQLSRLVQEVSRRAAEIVVGSVSTAFNLFISLIITFYMLMDFDRLKQRVLFLMPRHLRREAVHMVTEVGTVFGNYVRGMSLVASVYGVVAFILFMILGIVFNIGLKNYGLLLGVLAGVLYPVPFLGPVITSLLAAAVALATGGSVTQTVIVLVIVQAQNAVFDNVIVPRVVGGKVGLHPLTTLFALLLGGQLFGLAGMLLSVPTAASLQKILIRFYPEMGEPTPMIPLRPAEEAVQRDDSSSHEIGGQGSGIKEK